MNMELQPLTSKNDTLAIAFAESRIGGRRENQDTYGYAQTERGLVVTVCDGMGGGPGGKTASMIAVQTIIESLQNGDEDQTVSNLVIKAIRNANMAIIEAGNADSKLRGMGSTATVLLLSEHSAIVAHVGDSRVYQLRGNRKVFRTFDHSMVFDLVSQGVITEEQARLSAQSNVITRALGIQPDVEVDVVELPYQAGDRFMLCTDGIHGTMPENDLLRMATSRKSALGAVCDNVATTVDKMGRDAGGGHDNLTIALIETKKDSKLLIPMSKKTKTILLSLIVLCLFSLAGNVWQAVANSGDEVVPAASKGAPTGSNLENDTPETQNDTLQSENK